MNISGINALVLYKVGGRNILILCENLNEYGKCEPGTKNVISMEKFIQNLQKKEQRCVDIIHQHQPRYFEAVHGRPLSLFFKTYDKETFRNHYTNFNNFPDVMMPENFGRGLFF